MKVPAVLLAIWLSYAGAVGLRADVAGDAAMAATARKLTAIRNQPLLLEAFLREMPKGGDLHNHLSGAVYAESYLKWAAEDNLCLVVATFSLAGGACDANAGRPAASAVFQDSNLYTRPSMPGRCGTGRRAATATTISSRRSKSSASRATGSATCWPRLPRERPRKRQLSRVSCPRRRRPAVWAAKPDGIRLAQMRTRCSARVERGPQAKLRLDAARAHELLKCGRPRPIPAAA